MPIVQGIAPTARAAFTRPLPKNGSLPRAPRSSLVLSTIRRICVAFVWPFAITDAATPATSGDEKLVPAAAMIEMKAGGGWHAGPSITGASGGAPGEGGSSWCQANAVCEHCPMISERNDGVRPPPGAATLTERPKLEYEA